MTQKLFQNCYFLNVHIGIDDLISILLEKCEKHKKSKERETFWQHRIFPD